MASKVVIDDGRRCARGTRVAFVPAAPDSRTLQMIEDSASPLTLRTTATIRIDDVMHLHITVKRKKVKTKMPADC